MRGALSRPVLQTKWGSRIGPLLYLSSFQYFVIQFLVAIRWSPSYSLSRNTISDLGNTVCGRFDGRFVCSQFHTLMNLSFVGLGASMIAGSVLMARSVATNRARSWGFTFIAVGGFGVVLVGTFPENANPALHGIGAFLPFFVGNLGVLIFGLSRGLPRRFRLFSLTCGTASLVALLFYVLADYLGLGEGGLERIVAYPQTIWLILFGVLVLAHPIGDGPIKDPISS